MVDVELKLDVGEIKFEVALLDWRCDGAAVDNAWVYCGWIRAAGCWGCCWDCCCWGRIGCDGNCWRGC